jgi:hypothetical protein
VPNITGARAYVTVPAPEARLGGLFPTARVIDVSGHELLGAEYQTDACTPAEHWSAGNCGYGYPATPCNPDGTPTLKTFHGLTDVTGDPFTIYDGIDCNLLGTDDLGGRVRAALSLKEAKAVETHVLTLLQAAGGAATSAADIVAQIAAAEDWLAENYEGQGVIHMSRGTAALACAAQAVSPGLDGTLATCQGTPIANGAGYSALGDSVVASGQITLLRGPVEFREAPQMDNGDGTCSPPRSLAERTYVALIECGAQQIDKSA